MSSYVMHMCVSDIVKRKLNLTDKYVYGSVLPDIMKVITKDRNKTHYLDTKVIDGDIRNLPNIEFAIQDLQIEDKEIRLGYISHLIEDYIWFNNYIPKYAKVLTDVYVEYLKDKSKHTSKEFHEDMYSDYANAGPYIIQKCSVDMDKLKQNICNGIEKSHKELIDMNTSYVAKSDISENILCLQQDVDSYIEETVEEVYKVMKKLMGE